MALEMVHSSGRMGSKMKPITVAVRLFMGYKYLIHLVLITISHSFFSFSLRFTFLAFYSQTMEDKRGTKRTHSSSKEGSPSSSGAPTPPSAPSGSPPPLGSPPEVSSCHPPSLVFEQGGSSRKAPLVDLSLSSDEEGLILDISRDDEFSRRLFGDLNHDVLRPPGDDNIIILSDSDDEEEVHEEDVVDIEVAPSSAAGIPASTTSTTDVNEDLMQDDNSDDLAPIRRQAMAAAVETRFVRLRLLCQGGTCREACFKENFNGSTLLLHILFCAEEWRW
jgi:hypothetical protein